MIKISNLLAGLCLCVAELAAQNVSYKESLPNIVIILADDLGYGDVGCYGAKNIKTPNLDKLASEGVRLTNFYSNGPECTPTRTALLTGRYQQRVGGLECAIGLGNIGRYEEALALSNKGELGLPVQLNVLPAILKQKGYNTALIGKWHLGNSKQYSPVAHGFDYSIGLLGGAVDYFHHTEPRGVFLGNFMEGDHDFFRNGQPHQRDGYYMTHLITDESVSWINNQRKNQPFFLYIPYTAPHDPYQGPDDYSPEKLTTEKWSVARKNTYEKMVQEMDDGIGKIIARLEEKGFAGNTIIVFMSDNGPTKIGSAGPFSGNKGSVFEGGIRVPCIIKWPGKVPAGSTSNQIGITMDITASISTIIGGKPDRPLDGFDLIGHIANGKKDIHRTLFWRKLRGETVFKAVRDGNMKYINNNDGKAIREFLFDISTDPAETRDLKASNPKEFNRLKQLMQVWEQETKPERYALTSLPANRP